MFDVKPVVSLKFTDCGPTCLKMLLDYYGQDVDLDTLIEECHVGVDGCTGTDLMTCGRLHGLDMYACENTDEEGRGVPWKGVTKQDRPSIIWWKRSHFCVCCGEDEAGNVVICNPDRGRYSISKSLFDALYSNKAFFNGEPHDLPDEGEKGEENAEN